MLTDFTKYKNRQIIINEYDDEELINRTGFLLDKISNQNNDLLFFKNGQVKYKIIMPVDSVFRKDGSFPNFYVMESGPYRTEIYFP